MNQLTDDDITHQIGNSVRDLERDPLDPTEIQSAALKRKPAPRQRRLRSIVAIAVPTIVVVAVATGTGMLVAGHHNTASPHDATSTGPARSESPRARASSSAPTSTPTVKAMYEFPGPSCPILGFTATSPHRGQYFLGGRVGRPLTISADAQVSAGTDTAYRGRSTLKWARIDVDPPGSQVGADPSPSAMRSLPTGRPTPPPEPVPLVTARIDQIEPKARTVRLSVVFTPKAPGTYPVFAFNESACSYKEEPGGGSSTTLGLIHVS